MGDKRATSAGSCGSPCLESTRDDAFDAAFAEGRAMTMDEAIAYALEQVTPVAGQQATAPTP